MEQKEENKKAKVIIEIDKYGIRVGDRLSSITYHVSLSGKSMRI